MPWGSNEWSWRAAIAKHARAAHAAAGLQAPAASACFAVDMHFFFTPGNLERADLDNLAKPVLDTLFLAREPQVKDSSLAGAAFQVDDTRVFSLNLVKSAVAASADEGIDVVVTW